MLWVRALASFVFSLDSFFSFSVGTTDNGWAAVLYVLHNYFWSCVKLLLLSSVHYTFYLCIYKHIEKLWLKSEFLVFCVSKSEIFQHFSNHQRQKPRWAYSKSIPISSKGHFSFHTTHLGLMVLVFSILFTLKNTRVPVSLFWMCLLHLQPV